VADTLAITLHASAAETGSGSGAAQDLFGTDEVELRRLARLDLSVSALASGATLACTVQTSADNTVWASVTAFATASATGRQTLWLGDLDRYVRVVWTLTGASATFAVSGSAYSTFCSLDDLQSHGIVAETIAGTSLELRTKACLAASAVARGYILRHATAPITTCGFDLAMRTAVIAAYNLLLSQVGFDPRNEQHALLKQAHDEALRWLREDVGGGKYSVTETVADATPETPDGYSVVNTRDARGWADYGVL